MMRWAVTEGVTDQWTECEGKRLVPEGCVRGGKGRCEGKGKCEGGKMRGKVGGKGGKRRQV